ncbi:condensation domain-containing protein [Flexibacterium corallicola]|uniref:condensation domain-containing protein n=1 Tax=Flexibacterium corallicola TaxID=3037259 RepID=UPI00286F404E|nr:condensation domain-containing protein [Pseudovibrio sp. M1P-2-3]
MRNCDPNTPNYVPPRNEFEYQLCHIWSEVLGLQKIGVNSNFFQVGGESIHAIKLVTQINQQLGRQLTVATIFRHPTIATLSASLAETQHQPLIISRAPDQPQYPLSFAQERLWFIEQYERGTSAYHMPMLFRLSNEVNHSALKSSLALIVNRHEVLRTCFVKDTEGTYFQRICGTSFSIPEHFIENGSWGHTLKDVLHQTFNLEHFPPIRAGIYHVNGQAYFGSAPVRGRIVR